MVLKASALDTPFLSANALGASKLHTLHLQCRYCQAHEHIQTAARLTVCGGKMPVQQNAGGSQPPPSDVTDTLSFVIPLTVSVRWVLYLNTPTSYTQTVARLSKYLVECYKPTDRALHSRY